MDTKVAFANAHKVDKLWGYELWLVNNEKYCAKILKINPGYQCSLHYHKVKDETFYVLTGTVHLEEEYPDRYPRVWRVLIAGDSHRIYPGTPHRFYTTSQTGATVLEISTHHDEGDVVRLEESGPHE